MLRAMDTQREKHVLGRERQHLASHSGHYPLEHDDEPPFVPLERQTVLRPDEERML